MTGCCGRTWSLAGVSGPQTGAVERVFACLHRTHTPGFPSPLIEMSPPPPTPGHPSVVLQVGDTLEKTSLFTHACTCARTHIHVYALVRVRARTHVCTHTLGLERVKWSEIKKERWRAPGGREGEPGLPFGGAEVRLPPAVRQSRPGGVPLLGECYFSHTLCLFVRRCLWGPSIWRGRTRNERAWIQENAPSPRGWFCCTGIA